MIHLVLVELTLVELCLEEATLEEFCGDIVMDNDAPSIGLTDSICTESLNSTLISSCLLPTTPSHLHAFHESLSDISKYHSSVDLDRP